MEQLKFRIKNCTQKIKYFSNNSFIKEQFQYSQNRDENFELFSEVGCVLKDIYSYLVSLKSIDDAMKNLPETGQLLSEISHVPVIFSFPQYFSIWMKCVFWFHKKDASSSTGIKATDWAIRLLQSMVSCQINTNDSALKSLGTEPSKLLKKQLLLNIYKIIKLLESGNDQHSGPNTKNVRLLKGISNILLTIYTENGFSSLWFSVLQLLSQCPQDDDILKIHQTLTELQQEAYTEECKVKLSYKTLIILWTSYLPALEQEVLLMVETVSLSSCLPSVIKKIIQSRDLAIACCENYQVSLAVHEMLYSLYVQTGHSSVMCDTVMKFSECMEEVRELNFTKNEIFIPETLYSPELQPLVTLLNLPIKNFNSEKACHHLSQISNVMRDVLATITVTPELVKSLTLLTLKSKHWINKALWNVMQCDKKYIESCLDVIYLSQFYDPNIQNIKSSTREMLNSLRGLLGKTNLKLPDIEYAIYSSVKSVDNNRTLQQILIVFLFQSVSGLHFAEDILKLATANMDAITHLYVLVYSHQIFDIDLTKWSPYKLTKYRQLLKTLKHNLLTRIQETSELGTKVVQCDQEILNELDKVLHIPALHQCQI